MAFRNQTKIPKLCLVYFRMDQTTCIVETKKLRSKDSGEPFSCLGPKRGAKVTVRSTGKLLDAMVIALDGKFIILPIFVCFEVNWVPDFVLYIRQDLIHFKILFRKRRKAEPGGKIFRWRSCKQPSIWPAGNGRGREKHCGNPFRPKCKRTKSS